MDATRRNLLQGVGSGIALLSLARPTAAGSTERVFVHPRSGIVADLLTAIHDVDGTVILEYEHFDFVVAEIPGDRRDTLIADLRVAFVEDDHDVGIPADWLPSLLDVLDPHDPADCSTHPDQRGSWGWERIGAGEVTQDGAGIDIGILDTGIQPDHCSLAVAGGRNFTGTVPTNDYRDRHGHGTHVAGIVSALDNEIGVVGVAPAANLHAVKVLDDGGAGRYSWLVAGIDWCMSNDIELISMSLGGESDSVAVDRAIEDAHEAGHMLLAAAGNEGNSGTGCTDDTMTYPATHPDVVAVTAMNRDESFAPYSSVGSAIDILAPGTDIQSTFVNNGYAEASGTSIACPFVTGVAALVWQHRAAHGPGSNETVRSILVETAEPVLETCEEGDGLVDARAAVADERASDGDGTGDGHEHDEPSPGDDRVGAEDETPPPRDDPGTVDEEPSVGRADDSAASRLVTFFRSLTRRLRAMLEDILDLVR